MAIYNSEVSKWEVELKSDSSPLTRADKEANRIICDKLMVCDASFAGRMCICPCSGLVD